MGLTAFEYKAIAYYAQKHGLRLSLCQKPWIYFDNAGETERYKIGDIVETYEQDIKEDNQQKKQKKIGQDSKFVVRFPQKQVRDNASNKN